MNTEAPVKIKKERTEKQKAAFEKARAVLAEKRALRKKEIKA
jgi:hypothetical protein